MIPISLRFLATISAVVQLEAVPQPGLKKSLLQQLQNNSAFIRWQLPKASLVKAYGQGGPRLDLRTAEDNIKFYHSSLDYPEKHEMVIGDAATLNNYGGGKPLVLLCPGYDSNCDDLVTLKQAYFSQGLDYNIICIDWASLAAAPLYDLAAARTETVGYKVCHLIHWLLWKGVTDLDNMHFIGHDMGAHVGGRVANCLGTDNMARITGLSPAGLYFEDQPDHCRLDPSDANFVDVIHTTDVAMYAPCGHVDFYPNNGKGMPGCAWDDFWNIGACSIYKCIEYYAESIGYPWKFKASKCSSWEDYRKGLCNYQEATNMGEHASPSVQEGCYYTEVNEASPYSY